jgi:phosphoglycerate dehydrogenase-like enzyme
MGEHTLMMLLALGHQMPELRSLQSQAEWPADRWERFGPAELRDSTVGIVGYGSVGRQVARLLQSFGATVLATKRDVKQPEDQGYSPEGIGDPKSEFVRRLYPPEALRSMLKECDFVVITAPLTEENRGLIGADELSAIRPEAFLIDVSRGGIVDHEALIDFLQRDKLAGAALDVYPEEPLSAESPLWTMENVILSPHIAGMSGEYDQRAVELFSENLIRYLDEQPLYNVYDPQKGY